MFSFTFMKGKIYKEINVGSSPPIFVLNTENHHHIGSLVQTQEINPSLSNYIFMTLKTKLIIEFSCQVCITNYIHSHLI